MKGTGNALYFYKCRWCGEVFSIDVNHHISVAREVFKSIVHEQHLPRMAVPRLIESHQCDTERSGIADFVGYRGKADYED
jgi:hypothetical protein